MKYFLDTEFHEYKKNGIDTIELISIGLVTDKGNELYLVSNEFDLPAACRNEWLHTNVIRQLPHAHEWVSMAVIRQRILDMTRMVTAPMFYGYYSAYDWVVFCWIFGRMLDLPPNFPMYCIDLKQMMVERKLSKEWKHEHCPDPVGEHNALTDAQWNLKLYNLIFAYDQQHINNGA